MFKRIATGLAALGAVAGGYLLFIRPRQWWQRATASVVTRRNIPEMKQRIEREATAAPQMAPVPYAQSDGLTIYRFGQGEPVLFMPYSHAASVLAVQRAVLGSTWRRYLTARRRPCSAVG